MQCPSTQPSCLIIILEHLPGQDWSFSKAHVSEVASGGAEPGHAAPSGPERREPSAPNASNKPAQVGRGGAH